MSTRLPKSCEKYEQDTTRVTQMNSPTNNDTEVNCCVPESSNDQQTDKHNLTIWEDENQVNTGQLPSQVIVETVNYEDYIKQKNGGMVEIEEREDGDNIEVITLDDDDDEDSSPPVNRPRPFRPTTSSGTEQKQIITVSLRCPELGCEKTIGKDELNQHMWNRHSIGPSRCLVQNCGQSFFSRYVLGQHRAQCHQHTSQWHCCKCSKHFSTYQLLSLHHSQYHQLGQFECSFPFCTFTGEYKVKVYSHYAQHHRSVHCDRPGCCYVAPNVSNLKQHLQNHLEQFELYLCKWPQCHFASGTQAHTLAHIRSVHLKHNIQCTTHSNVTQPQLTHPNDYLKVIRFNR